MRASRLSTLVLLIVLAVVVAVTLMARGCGDDTREAIRVDEQRVVITNLTGQPWSNIEVWLNTWYRAQAPSLEPNQRLEIPLQVFVAGPGRHFERGGEGPTGILLTARARDGSPVQLVWGEGKPR